MKNITIISKASSLMSCLIFLLLFQSHLDAQIAIKGDALFGAMRARHIGPALMSGRVIDLQGDPSNSNILYVGSAGGGVWKTTNGGVSFEPIFDDHPQSIGSIAVDPIDPNQVWVGTGEIWTRNSVSVGDGLYKSENGGKDWKKIGFDQSERIASIQINPNNNKEIYVGVLGALWGDNEERGVFKTTDGGATWDKMLYINESTGCSDLSMDPSNPNILYAAMWDFRRTAYSFNSGGPNSALYKSVDGGKNWKKIHKGFPSGSLGRIGIGIAASEPNTLYSVIETEKKENNGLYKSIDGGESWEHKNKDFELAVRPFYFSRIVVHPNKPDMVAKAGLYGSISEDGGDTFRPIGSGVHADIHDFWFDPNDTERMYLGSDGGVYRSWDRGNVWEMVKGLPLSQFYHITVDNEKPFNVYGGLQDNGSWVGPSSSPAGVEAGDWKSVGYGDGFRVYPKPDDPNVVYSEMQGAENIWKVNIEKSQSRNVQPYAEDGEDKLRFNWNAPFTTSAHNPDRLYVGSQYLHLSNDQGDSWTKISGDLTTNDPAKQQQEESGGLSMDNSGAENHCTLFTIAESPLDENVIWVGTDDGNVQLTMNGGKSWKNTTANITGLPKNTWCYHIEPSNFDVNTAYAVFDGHTQNDMAAFVFKTSDGGNSWTSITTDDIYGFCRSIQEDYVNPDLLYLGTEFGLYVTVDGGKNWSKFTNNMPATAVHHVTLHPRDHALVMGTHGRGVIIIDDVRPLRQLTAEVAQKKVHFFDLGPQIMKESGGFGGTATFGEFVGANKSPFVEIVYFMNKRHTFGKMSLEIYNPKGEMISSLAPGKQKGINRVQWNYSYNPPKIAKAKTFAFSAFSTPTVSPGIYTLKLKKGKEVYESSIELIYDPESVHSDKERLAGHDTAMELYKMNETLAYIIDQVDAAHAGAKTLTEGSDKKLSKKGTELIQMIDAYKEDKIITKGDNYVGAVSPELREKITNLYGEIAGQVGKPSVAQLKRLGELKVDLAKAQKDLAPIMKSLGKLNGAMKKAGLAEIVVRSKEEFMEADI